MFFELERQHFFRPLNGKYREMVAACLRTLHERLHGPGADFTQTLTRDGLRDLLRPVVQTSAAAIEVTVPADGDEMAQIPAGDDVQLTGAIARRVDGNLPGSHRAGHCLPVHPRGQTVRRSIVVA